METANNEIEDAKLKAGGFYLKSKVVIVTREARRVEEKSDVSVE